MVRFASYDDLEIPGILYMSLQASEKVQVPWYGFTVGQRAKAESAIQP